MDSLQSRIERREYQIRMVRSKIADAQQSGVNPIDRAKWISRLKVKEAAHLEKLRELRSQLQEMEMAS